MSTDTLNLRLSKEEITQVITSVVGSKPYDIHFDSAHAIADAAVAKAVWAIHDWMIDQGFYDPQIDGNPAMFLQHRLTAAGIQKAEGE